uniref:NADH-ubiquinone oxidoreductase chain 2 n=1 Tax=Chrysomela vigintipunctata TaxID=153828 RepID=A0A7L7S6C6_CHRVG|nr:NADH dehydrogenase subunit 2 [Chrysomela vigintipunctata]QNV48728.1 NADH dehydrogenase subunit 2 [Chrysomela vigintipunctata]
MSNLYKILFFSTTVLGTLITIASYSWFSMWIGLEINLLSIIPLLKSPKSLYPTEAILKYFITQALASTILMFSIITMLNLETIFSSLKSLTMIIMNSALLTKMGAAPFHSWFPEVMEGLNWNNSMIMLTWQKIAPMILFSYNLQMTFFISFVVITSTVISGILGLNQVSLRKILAYSSINHIGWMIASMLSFKTIWLFYFLIYSTISLNIIVMFKYLNIFSLKQLFMALVSNKLMKILFAMNFLSLGGLPPFLGFFPKWLVVNKLIQNNFFSLSVILIIFTLITMFFYLRMTFPSVMLLTNETLNFDTKPLNFKIIFMNSITLLGLLICTLTFSLF